MASIAEELKTPKESLEEFYNLAFKILQYLPNVVSTKTKVRGYTIFKQQSAGSTKFARPINNDLFIYDDQKFTDSYKSFIKILDNLESRENFSKNEFDLIDSVTYTLQQSLGAGFDLLINPNSARKHVGNRFEELLRALIDHLEIPSKGLVFKIPYETEEGKKFYRCQTDLILSPHSKVKSTSSSLDPDEVILSFKTSSKDRMGKIFLDKLLMESFTGQKVKVVGIFHNDVQRKGEDNISYTLVSGRFMIYTNFLIQLDGVYFIDPPPNTKEHPFDKHIFPFSKFIIEDVWKLVK